MINVELLLEQLNELQIENDHLLEENKHLVSELEECENALEKCENTLEDLKIGHDKLKQLNIGTNCHFCNSKLIWNSDFSFEDYGISEEEGIVAFLCCSNCNTYAEFYHTIGEVE